MIDFIFLFYLLISFLLSQVAFVESDEGNFARKSFKAIFFGLLWPIWVPMSLWDHYKRTGK